jgi:hypothetical protein
MPDSISFQGVREVQREEILQKHRHLRGIELGTSRIQTKVLLLHYAYFIAELLQGKYYNFGSETWFILGIRVSLPGSSI